MFHRASEKVSAICGGLLAAGGLSTFVYGLHRRTWRGTGVSLFGLGVYWVLAAAFRWWPLPPHGRDRGVAADDQP